MAAYACSLLLVALFVSGVRAQGSCVAQGFTACCTSSPCSGSAGTSCYCDKLCYQYGDCCSDIEDSGCNPDCAHGDVRLVQTQNYYSWRGRIEICFNGVWGTVTDDGYDSREARVVCRQLGYSDLVTRPYPNAWFGAGSSSQPIFMDNINCNGNEERLIDCPYSTPSGDTHSEDASVRCYAFSDLNTTTCNTGDTRLIGGNTDREGRLELCFGGQWSTITDDGFSTFDAIVACRMMGYLDGYGMSFSQAYFGAGSGFISMDNVGCSGSPYPLQQSLFDCRYNMAVGDSHNEDVGVRCFDSLNTGGCELGQLRLAGGTNNLEGRIEICIDGIWGTISDDGWSLSDVQVACRQLGFSGYNAVVFASNQAVFGQGTGPIHMRSVGCNQKSLKLIQCNYDGRTTGDYHWEDAGLRCTASVCNEGTVRLVNGNVTSEGRVELCYLGQWAAVCDILWSIHEAQVVCGQLGYPNASKTVFPYINSHFGRGTLPYRADEAKCIGTESGLLQCSYSNYINPATCTSSDAAGVRCTPGTECTHGDVRLVGGPSNVQGRVELCLYGIWGTVSQDQFTNPDAWVVCRQLGFYNYSGRAYGGAHFGQGTGLVHIKNAACTGHEERLVDCPYSRDTAINNHAKDVSILCQQQGECNDGEIRIISAPNTNSTGRIGVCYKGVWGTILSPMSWSGRNAQVACRQLGYPRYAIAYASSYFFSGWNVATHIENVKCNGSEDSLFNCTWSEVTVMDTSVYDDNIGVRCFNETEATNGCNLGDVRIVSGNSSTEGRAEVCIAGQWGTICDDEWTDASANVLCGQAGFASVGARTMRNGNYQLSPGSIVMTKVVCSGDEKSIMDCRLEGDTSKCMHSSDVGVKCLPAECTNGQVRLMNGSTYTEGRVEVCQNRRWGTVCDSNWGVNEAQVVCREVGITAIPTLYALKQSAFGPGSGYIWLNNVDCQGSEAHLVNCSYSTDTTMCDHSREAGVKCMPGTECTPGDVRLVGGETRADGQVQICYNGQWGSIASDGWESVDAQVVCRQLGFPDITGVPVRGINFASTTAPIVMGEVSCVGNEIKLSDCSFDPDTSDHTYTQNAGVRCFPHACTGGSVRLVDGPSDTFGRVEICIGGAWGTISNYLWMDSAATVVCNQLFDPERLISATALNDTTQYGTSQDPILLHSARCTGTEESLFDCTLDTKTEQDSHDTDAGVSCQLKALTMPPVITSAAAPIRPSSTEVPTATMTTRPPETGRIDGAVALPIVGVIGGIVLVVIVILFVALVIVIFMKRRGEQQDDMMKLVGTASYPIDDTIN